MKSVTLIRQIINTGSSRVAEYMIRPRAVGSRHHHTRVFEKMYCLSGSVNLSIGEDKTVRLNPGDSAYIPAGTVHCVSSICDEPSRFLVIQGDGEFDIIKS